MFRLHFLILFIILLFLFIKKNNRTENYKEKNIYYYLNLEFKLNKNETFENLDFCSIKNQIKYLLHEHIFLDKRYLDNNFINNKINFNLKNDILQLAILVKFNDRLFDKIKNLDKDNIYLNINNDIISLKRFYYYQSNKEIVNTLKKLEKNINRNTLSSIYENNNFNSMALNLDKDNNIECNDSNILKIPEQIDIIPETDNSLSSRLNLKKIYSKNISNKTKSSGKSSNSYNLKSSTELMNIRDMILKLTSIVKTKRDNNRIGKDYNITITVIDKTNTSSTTKATSSTTKATSSTTKDPSNDLSWEWDWGSVPLKDKDKTITIKIGDKLIFEFVNNTKKNSSFVIKDSNNQIIINPATGSKEVRILVGQKEGIFKIYDNLNNKYHGTIKVEKR